MRVIKLTQGKSTFIDNDDFEKVNQYKWYASKIGNNYYAVCDLRRKEEGVYLYLHRFIMGVDDRKILIDHKDMDGLNNQKSNLRESNKSGNAANSRRRKSSDTKYRGVRKNKGCYTYNARITVKGKSIHIGNFKTENEAALAFNEMALKHHKNYATLNEIS